MKWKSAWEPGAEGFTLLEVLVAMLMLGMVSMMLYSVLNVSIRMTDKGEKTIYDAARQYGIMRLLHDQVLSAYYDILTRRVLVSGQGEVLRVVTRTPLRYRNEGVALAVYRYDAGSKTLYYTEKRDYYNIDYSEDYLPDYDEMLVLSTNVDPISFEVDEETQAVTVSYGENSYVLWPKCIDTATAGTFGRRL